MEKAKESQRSFVATLSADIGRSCRHDLNKPKRDMIKRIIELKELKNNRTKRIKE